MSAVDRPNASHKSCPESTYLHSVRARTEAEKANEGVPHAGRDSASGSKPRVRALGRRQVVLGNGVQALGNDLGIDEAGVE